MLSPYADTKICQGIGRVGTTQINMKRYCIIIAALLIFIPSIGGASSQPPLRDYALGPGGDAPGGDWRGVILPEGPETDAAFQWVLRTGFKKGVFGADLDEELFAGPDIAVLKAGHFEAWQGLLSDLKEPWVFVEPQDIAALIKTKRILIIPSGGLYGLSSSEFFRAGLSAFIRQGGAILCFSQQRGEDFAGLPVPAGASMITGIGWAEDSGPLFRASFIQGIHPALSGIKKSLPDMETDGFIETFPSESQVLLSRPDGRATALLYRIESGWVFVTTLFSEVSHERGILAADEMTFIRDMIAWAKSGTGVIEASPGKTVSLEASIILPSGIEAASAKVSVIAPDREALRYEQTIPISSPPSQNVRLPFSYAVPPDAKNGIYHIEYMLMDAKGRPLTGMVESSSGWFYIGRPSPVQKIGLASRPLEPFRFGITHTVSHEIKGENARISISISGEALPGGSSHFFARIAGYERFFEISSGKAEVIFDIPARKAMDSPVLSIYHSSGRLVSRADIGIPKTGKKGVYPERTWYAQGEAGRIFARGLGKGELTLTWIGRVDNEMVTESRPFEFTLPSDLPSAVYPVKWQFRHMDESIEEGEFRLRIEGHRASFMGADADIRQEGRTYIINGKLRVRSASRFSANLMLYIKGPDDKSISLGSRTVNIEPGISDLPFSVSIKPATSGIYELIYGIVMDAPEGFGLMENSVVLGGGRKLLDIGEAAILAITTDRPVYYDAKGPIDISAFVYGSGESKIEIFNNGKRIFRDRVKLSGLTPVTIRIDTPAWGFQTIGAWLRTGRLEAVNETSITYGTTLPDLSMKISLQEIHGATLPIAVLVKNRGSRPSLPTKAEIYEGMDRKRLIASLDLPALEPQREYFKVVPWTLQRAGDVFITAVVDRDGKITETNRKNNTDSAGTTIPDVILSISPKSSTMESTEPLILTISVFNLSDRPYKAMNLIFQVIDPRGAVEKTVSIAIPDLQPKKGITIEHNLSIGSIMPGRYILNGELTTASIIASSSLGIDVLPTLSIAGELDGTPKTASFCMPFTIQYSVKNRGNIPPSTMDLTAEITTPGLDRPAAVFKLQSGEGKRALTIDRLTVPPGGHILSIKAVATNKAHNITREFTLSEQPLTISSPVEVTKISGAMPRILIWSGRYDAEVLTALSKTVLDQAFSGRTVYYKIVDSVEDFENQALTGMFNTYVLMDQDAMLTRPAWLRERIEKGDGLIIIGDGERSVATAAEFGFRPASWLPADMRIISFTKEAGDTLSGTLPISSRLVQMDRKGAKPVALTSDGKIPAILSGPMGRGRITVVPFSMIRSAMDTGAIPIYSLVIGTLSISQAPEHASIEGPVTGGFTISSTHGPVKTRIIENLPQSSKIIWTSGGGTVTDSTITYEITADRTLQSFMYLYETKDRSERPSRDVSFECNGRFVGIGKME